ncbi:CoA transferase [Streptomyces sp. NPDC058697]|uniref:CoA transferase n=2 Tax=unclassified Streptomyces TaxID=2593676 RepID=UPI00366021F0
MTRRDVRGAPPRSLPEAVVGPGPRARQCSDGRVLDGGSPSPAPLAEAGPAETVRRWLRTLGGSPLPPAAAPAPGCPFLDWAASGAMELTGEEDGPPVLTPGPMVSLVREAGAALEHIAGRLLPVDPALVLGGRAGAMNLTRRGRTSVGGTTRLLRASDGWCAVSLSRPDDLELVPAMLGRPDVTDPWQELTTAVRGARTSEFTDHVRMFGVPAASLPPEPPLVDVPWQVSTIAPTTGRVQLEGALVVDLSSLWAGPLCAHLLGLAGARVVKVESTRRPDGARAGSRPFYDWLHFGHESVAVDFTVPAGRGVLADLLRAADVVIEASRPRALAQLGLAPERLDHRAGKVWVSITGYGRGRPDRVAFGDDAAVAGGLVGRSADGRPVFCADAVADPLTGVVAALGAMGALVQGGGRLIDVSMRNVAAAFAAAPPADHGPHPVRTVAAGTVVDCPALGRTQAVLPPRAPVAEGTAAVMGADTARILSPSTELRRRSDPR